MIKFIDDFYIIMIVLVVVYKVATDSVLHICIIRISYNSIIITYVKTHKIFTTTHKKEKNR